MFLASDIGGTKTALALYSAERGPRDPIVECVFPSQQFDTLEEIVASFLERASISEPVQAAAFGVAGPVVDHESNITNLSWTVRRGSLAEVLDLAPDRVALLNDLEATATAVPQLLAEDLRTLNEGKPVEEAPIAVIAPGTGLGQAFLTWDGTRYRPHPSEGGHVDFAPCNQTQLDLLNYLYRKYDHVSFERVVSGMGIPEMYNFLRDTRREEHPESLAEELNKAGDKTPVILSHAGDYPICKETLDMFVAILGAKAGNVALSLMSRGGVFLGGGIPPRILPSLQSAEFMEAFSSKGRFSHMVAQIPVHVIMNPATALLGAAYAALSLSSNET